ERYGREPVQGERVELDEAAAAGQRQCIAAATRQTVGRQKRGAGRKIGRASCREGDGRRASAERHRVIAGTEVDGISTAAERDDVVSAGGAVHRQALVADVERRARSVERYGREPVQGERVELDEAAAAGQRQCIAAATRQTVGRQKRGAGR